MGRCHIFDYEDANEAGKDLDFDVLTNYGEEFEGKPLYTWDDGGRILIKCKKCGGLILYQKSECHGYSGNDDYYRDFFPVESEEEAIKYNRTLNGYDIESQFPGKYLSFTNGKYAFCNEKVMDNDKGNINI